MTTASIQDRTGEFRAILNQAQKRNASSKPPGQRASLLTPTQKQEANGEARAPKQGSRSEFARNAAQIGRGITDTMAKLEKLAQLARRKTLFDDPAAEISSLTYVIKQSLATLNQQISSLQALTQNQHPRAAQAKSTDQEGQHNNNVVIMLQGNVAKVAENFKDVLEVRTKNIQASRSRTEHFVSSVAAQSQASLDNKRSESPLYQTPSSRQRTPQSGYQNDILSLEPSSSSALSRGAGSSDQQLLMMEEAQPQNTYINQRGQAIESIEK
ncbi:MAG: hypothetical protein Q9227_006501 [Pyrenula ochraceoflavens]